MLNKHASILLLSQRYWDQNLPKHTRLLRPRLGACPPCLLPHSVGWASQRQLLALLEHGNGGKEVWRIEAILQSIAVIYTSRRGHQAITPVSFCAQLSHPPTNRTDLRPNVRIVSFLITEKWSFQLLSGRIPVQPSLPSQRIPLCRDSLGKLDADPAVVNWSCFPGVLLYLFSSFPLILAGSESLLSLLFT